MLEILNSELFKNIAIISLPSLTAFLLGLTNHSKNKVVQKYGSYVIVRGYEKFGNLTGQERKGQAIKYLQNLANEVLPVGIRGMVNMWFQVLGSHEVQKAYDDYWEREVQDMAERYQWNGNVEPEEGVYYG